VRHRGDRLEPQQRIELAEPGRVAHAGAVVHRHRALKDPQAAQGALKELARLRGRLTVEGNGRTTRRLAPVAARLLLDVRDELRAEIHADQRARSLFAAEVRVGASGADLQDAAALADAPLSVDANVGPLWLSEL
jgi:hypothetical protein